MSSVIGANTESPNTAYTDILVIQILHLQVHLLSSIISIIKHIPSFHGH